MENMCDRGNASVWPLKRKEKDKIKPRCLNFSYAVSFCMHIYKAAGARILKSKRRLKQHEHLFFSFVAVSWLFVPAFCRASPRKVLVLQH